MNRSIAYRAWDVRRHHLLPVGGLRFLGDELEQVQAPIRPESDKFAWYSAADFELMEATGVVDGSREMIYEGDIARLGKEGLWTVVYDRGQFVLQSPDETIQRSLALYTDDPALVVIGNVFEDANLLATKKS